MMFARSRIGLKPLAQLCRRLAIASDAGIDIRKIWEREAAAAPRTLQPPLASIRDDIATGTSFTESVNRTGGFFPPLFRQLVDVGEQTGSLVEVFRALADYYEHRLSIQRIFLMAMFWPMFQLGAAILIVGFLIWIMGVIASAQGGEPIDLLGLGLSGTSGLVTYVLFFSIIAALLGLLIRAMRRGMLWTRPIQRFMMRMPGVGKALQTMALSRISWVLKLLLNVEMDLRRVLPLALQSTGSDYYSRHAEAMVADVVAGATLYEAFAHTGVFPTDFVDAIEVGEQSGKLVESMGRLSDRYEQQAKTALSALAVLAGIATWLGVAGIIIFLIFRIASFYVGMMWEFMPS